MRRPLIALAVLAIVLLGQVAPAAAAEAGDPPPYRIGPRDLLDVSVFEVPELNVERRVDEDGTIRLPLLGDLEVSGLTAGEAAEKLRSVLEERYVQRASVAVEVREFRSRPIAVIGAVREPGNLVVSGRWTLMEAIAAAGGLTDDHGDTVLVLRRTPDGPPRQITLDLKRLMVDADPDANIAVYAGDLINIPATVEVTVFCLGEVEKPGALTFKSHERLSLLAALARAGGLTDRASSKILIRRRGDDGADHQIEVSYKRVVDGKEPDPELQANDVVVVKESFF